MERWVLQRLTCTTGPYKTGIRLLGVAQNPADGFPARLLYFDQRGIAWQYEPVRLSGWTPDFRLVLDGVEAYAEVKPVSEFPMDVAQRVLNAGWTGDILILGREPRHAWRHRGDGWTPVDLAT